MQFVFSGMIHCPLFVDEMLVPGILWKARLPPPKNATKQHANDDCILTILCLKDLSLTNEAMSILQIYSIVRDSRFIPKHPWALKVVWLLHVFLFYLRRFSSRHWMPFSQMETSVVCLISSRSCSSLQAYREGWMVADLKVGFHGMKISILWTSMLDSWMQSCRTIVANAELCCKAKIVL